MFVKCGGVGMFVSNIFLMLRPPIVIRARHVCAAYKVIWFERIVNLCMGLTKDVVRM